MRYSRTLTGLLLCGGAGRRMGGDKPLRLWRDRPLYTYPLAVLREFCEPVLAVGRELPDCAFVADEQPGLGPLGGLRSGLLASPHDWCLCLAADMPCVDPLLVQRLLDHREGARAVVPRGPAGPEPLLAVYHRELAETLPGPLKARAWVESLPAVAWVEVEDGASFRNLNRPEDLQ